MVMQMMMIGGDVNGEKWERSSLERQVVRLDELQRSQRYATASSLVSPPRLSAHIVEITLATTLKTSRTHRMPLPPRHIRYIQKAPLTRFIPLHALFLEAKFHDARGVLEDFEEASGEAGAVGPVEAFAEVLM